MEKLTAAQRRALTHRFNLADAHARQPQSSSEQAIIDRLPTIFRRAAKAESPQLTAAVYKSFTMLTGQIQASYFPYLPCISASIATEIVANLLRYRKRPVQLVEPCFDNIPDILRRHDIELTPFPTEDTANNLGRADTIFIVNPNNPTGYTLNEHEFEAIANLSATRGILLVFDFCFRSFDAKQCTFDQYAILREAGSSFIALEDTGKTWPTLDQKVSFIVCSSDHVQLLSEIHNDFQLEVSPLTLQLVLEFIENSRLDNLMSVRKLIDANRTFLRSRMAEIEPPIRLVNAASKLSIEWLELPRGFKATEVSKHVANLGVSIHPGPPFYWASPANGERFIRVALARGQEYFQEAISVLTPAMNRFKPRDD